MVKRQFCQLVVVNYCNKMLLWPRFSPTAEQRCAALLVQNSAEDIAELHKFKFIPQFVYCSGYRTCCCCYSLIAVLCCIVKTAVKSTDYLAAVIDLVTAWSRLQRYYRAAFRLCFVLRDAVCDDLHSERGTRRVCGCFQRSSYMLAYITSSSAVAKRPRDASCLLAITDYSTFLYRWS